VKHVQSIRQRGKKRGKTKKNCRDLSCRGQGETGARRKRIFKSRRSNEVALGETIEEGMEGKGKEGNRRTAVRFRIRNAGETLGTS